METYILKRKTEPCSSSNYWNRFLGHVIKLFWYIPPIMISYSYLPIFKYPTKIHIYYQLSILSIIIIPMHHNIKVNKLLIIIIESHLFTKMIHNKINPINPKYFQYEFPIWIFIQNPYIFYKNGFSYIFLMLTQGLKLNCDGSVLQAFTLGYISEKIHC